MDEWSADVRAFAAESMRYTFLESRDGGEAAAEWMRTHVVATYRKIVLEIQRSGRYGMYRRKLIESYLSAKQVLRHRQDCDDDAQS